MLRFSQWKDAADGTNTVEYLWTVENMQIYYFGDFPLKGIIMKVNWVKCGNIHSCDEAVM